VNHEEPYRNQAERLRKKIEKVKDGEVPVLGKNELPSRTDIHRNKKNKTKLKVKFPIIRLLALFFILLPVGIFSAYSVLGSKEINTSDKVGTIVSGGVEEINVEDSGKAEVEVDEMTETNTPMEEVEVIEKTEEENNENSADQKATLTEKEEEVDTTNQTSIEKEPTQTGTSNVGETTTTTTTNMVYHTVQPKETLFRIAMKYYQSQSGIEIIQTANNLNGNEIMVGQVLKIPK
jgi:LysM repeat protein